MDSSNSKKEIKIGGTRFSSQGSIFLTHTVHPSMVEVTNNEEPQEPPAGGGGGGGEINVTVEDVPEEDEDEEFLQRVEEEDDGNNKSGESQDDSSRNEDEDDPDQDDEADDEDDDIDPPSEPDGPETDSEESNQPSAFVPDPNWSRVLKSLFKVLDVETIKIARLINKMWDFAACSELTERTLVNLEGKTEEQIQEFAFLLQSNHKYKRSCPFKRYNLKVKATYDQFLDVILKDEETHIVRLDYAVERNLKNDAFFPNYLYDLLQQSSSTLQLVKFSMLIHGYTPKRTTALNLRETQRFPLYLPNLTDFEYWNLSTGLTPIPISFLLFPYQILLGAINLQRFYCSSGDYKMLDLILSQHILGNIPDVHLTDFPIKSFVTLSETAWTSQIKSLGLQRFMSDQPGFTYEVLKNLVRNVGPTIEELAISGVTNINSRLLPSAGCPNLRTLLLDNWMGNLNVFNADKFPQLRTVIISNYHGNAPIRFQVKPMCHVEKVVFKGHVDLGNQVQDEIREEYSRLFIFFHYCFPNITRFHLKMAELTYEVVRRVIEIIPQLEELVLSSSVGVARGFTHLLALGINEGTLAHHVSSKFKNTLKYTHTKRLPCLLDLPFLKSLSIYLYDKKNYIPLSIFRFGISNIPSLERFSFNYHYSTQNNLKAIAGLLAHLRELTIFYNGRTYWYGRYWTGLQEVIGEILEERTVEGGTKITVTSDQDPDYLYSYRDKFDTLNYQFTPFIPKSARVFAMPTQSFPDISSRKSTSSRKSHK